jgi:phage shock protein PspC (stress-responsive transcriptional regulator)
MKKLFRNKDKGSIAGVCHGLGYYFNVDPVLIRGAFIMAGLLMPPFAILAYLTLWVVTPKYNNKRR